ncbi:MAG: antitermination protein NusB [Coriobacteriia bacterium]|nr:antitermination protein NusB [Coriobacteriia bacterium]
MPASAARKLAREVLTRVRESQSYGHEVLSAALGRTSLSAEDASFATRLAYGALQTSGTLDEIIDRCHTGKRLEPRIRDALQVATYEIVFLHTEDRAAVHQGVELVKTVRPQASGLANAVLRRVAQEAPAFPWGDPAHDDAALARLNAHPEWIAALWIAELGRDTAALTMDADNQPAPLFLAANPFRSSLDEVVLLLEQEHAKPSRCPVKGCLRASEAGHAVRGATLASGKAIAVDAAAQLVARLVAPAPGSTVVEIGAGRGTKTLLMQSAAVAAGGSCQLHTIDNHDFKTRLLAERMRKLGVPGVMAHTADATDIVAVSALVGPGTADRVLIDAPCSGLGTLRRHPEKRWRVTPEDVAALAALGSRLLATAATLVRPGGFVVYSTCTLANQENSDVVSAFLASEQGRGFALDTVRADVPDEWQHCVASEGWFQSIQEPDGPDGHFAARLVRLR